MSRREFPVHSTRYLLAYAVIYGAWLTIRNVVRRYP